jgi:hypothetical protein
LGGSSACREAWLRAGLVLVAGALLYGNTLANELVWDDRLTAAAAADDPLAALARPTGSYYRPVVMPSFALDAALWGSAPAGFHATNLVCHVAVAWLVGGLAAALGASPGTALASALVFAAHPVQTEAVAYVSGRTDLLCALFVLLGLLAWRRSVRATDRFAVACAAAFAFALLSKEAAAAVPLVLLLPGAHPGPAPPRPVLPLLVAALWWVAWLTAAPSGIALDGVSARLPAVAIAALGHAWLLVWPADLHLERFVAVPGWSVGTTLAAWSAMGAGLLALLLLARRAPGGALLLALAALSYAPVSGIVPVYPAIAARALFTAEHFLYLPLVGLVPLAVGALATRRPPGAPALLIALLLAWGLVVVDRNRDWRSEESIFRDTLRHDPPAARVWFNLGNRALADGRLDEAERLYEAALVREPNDGGTHLNLGVVHQRRGHLADAERHYRAAAASVPPPADASRALEAVRAARTREERDD